MSDPTPSSKRPYLDSPTGQMPPIREPLRREAAPEPEEPPQLPEFPDGDGVTGTIHIVPEGDDAARLADDSATKSASKNANQGTARSR